MKNKKSMMKVFFRIFCLFFLIVSVALATAPRQSKSKTLKGLGLAKLKGCPDNSGIPYAPESFKVKPTAIDPPDYHTYPPYAPTAMRAIPGFTGIVTYTNSSGIALIDPGRRIISPIMLNEYDYTIDPETDAPIGGPLGSEGGGRFDVALNRRGTIALISNFGDSKVFIVNLASGTPVVAATIQIDFFAEDITIDPTDRWALVSNGGFSTRIAVINIPNRTWVPAGVDPDTGEPFSFSMPAAVIDDPADPYYPGYGRYANGIEIAADGRTVVCPDYFAGRIHVLLFNPQTGGLTVTQSEMLWKYGTDENSPQPFLYRPVNAAISPDGRTVLLSNVVRSLNSADEIDPLDPTQIVEGANVPVFTIDRPGHIIRRPDAIMPFEVSGGQCIVFSHDGRRAYYETVYWIDQDIGDHDQEIQVLSVGRGGNATRTGAIRLRTYRGTSQLFGVDTMAISPDGNFLFVTNPTVSGGQPIIEVVDLNRQIPVKQITTPTDYPDPIRNFPDPPLPPDPSNPNDYIAYLIPEGLAFPAIPPNQAPVAIITVDKPEVILDIGEVATFDGSGSNDPEHSPLTYTWSLVSSPAGATATLTPAGNTAVLIPDPNIEGYYEVGLVVNDGQLDSPMATASVLARFYPVLPPMGVQLQRLEDNYIFYKEYVNRLTWVLNPESKAVLGAFNIYRKLKDTADSNYTLLATLPPTVFVYDDKALTSTQLFTYRITAVNYRGKESESVVVSN